MSRGIRTLVLAAGAAALLSGQGVAATSAPRLDPLVSISVLGTAQSRAAVCASSLAGAAAAAAQAPAPGCVLPVIATPPPPPPVGDAVPPPLPPAGTGIGIWPLLLGLAAIVGVAALVLSSDDGDGDVTPISP